MNDRELKKGNVREVIKFTPHENFEWNKEYDIMIIEIESAFDGINVFSDLYGCPEMFKKKNSDKKKTLKCLSIGCGSVERTKNSSDSQTPYYGQHRRFINIDVNYGPDACFTLPKYLTIHFQVIR